LTAFDKEKERLLHNGNQWNHFNSTADRLFLVQIRAHKQLHDIPEVPILLVRLIHVKEIFISSQVDFSRFFCISVYTLLLIPLIIFSGKVEAHHDYKRDRNGKAGQDCRVSRLGVSENSVSTYNWNY
jgi:hypothetical protein